MKEVPRIVDLGCGEDEERWIPGTIKVDLNLDEAFAKEHDILVEDAEDLPFPDNSVDVFIMRYSISWMFYTGDDENPGVPPDKVFTELLRCLKPGGLVWIWEQLEMDQAQMLLGYSKFEDPKNEAYYLERSGILTNTVNMGDNVPYIDMQLEYTKIKK